MLYSLEELNSFWGLFFYSKLFNLYSQPTTQKQQQDKPSKKTQLQPSCSDKLSPKQKHDFIWTWIKTSIHDATWSHSDKEGRLRETISHDMKPRSVAIMLKIA